MSSLQLSVKGVLFLGPYEDCLNHRGLFPLSATSWTGAGRQWPFNKNQSPVVISPLWDSQLRVQSNKMFPNRGIYYRFERNESLLLRASNLIRSAKGFGHGLDFEADWLVIVTFNEIGTTAHIGTLYQQISSNTYQMILAGDDKMTFAIFLYPVDAMEWWDARSMAGFNAGSFNYSYRLGPDKDCGSIGSELPEQSYSCAALGSNTGVQGLWILSSTLGKHFCLNFWKNVVEKTYLSYLWNRVTLINHN